MAQEYPNSGALFKTKEKKFDWSPDLSGSIQVDRDYLITLLREQPGLVTIKINANNKEYGAGEKYLKLKVDTWKPDQKSQKSAKDPWDE
jgi:hypothetical protein